MVDISAKELCRALYLLMEGEPLGPEREYYLKS